MYRTTMEQARAQRFSNAYQREQIKLETSSNSTLSQDLSEIWSAIGSCFSRVNCSCPTRTEKIVKTSQLISSSTPTSPKTSYSNTPQDDDLQSNQNK